MTSLKTISRAVSCDSAPLVRTVRHRTVANTLSIGFAVRAMRLEEAIRGSPVVLGGVAPTPDLANAMIGGSVKNLGQAGA